ncbi:MAG TPA: enoyl-CoA hydratase-related protein [Nocardioides sp.]|nr:enoyl-CoA hydratase-related protein [Nocardioides sp.]
MRTLVERLYAALAAGDVATITSLLTEDFVGHLTPSLPFGIGGDHEGPEAMMHEGWFRFGEHWRVRTFPDAFEPLEDGRLQVTGTYRGRGRRSGAPFEAPFVHTWTFRDGRIAALTQLTDSAAFRDALGDAAPLRTFDLSVEDGLAVLRIDRPDVRNAIDQDLADELLVAARRIAGDPGVRALLICGSGPDLTVGGDIGYFAGDPEADLASTLRSMTTPFHLAFQVLATLEVPIVTAARGAVAGGGLGFVYAADIVVAADDTRFVTAFAQIGLSGDGGGTWHLPRRIGPARAAAAYLLNEPITAQQGLDWGLVAEVLPADDVEARARALARRLADGPTRAYGAMRRLLRESWDRSLPDQLDAEVEALATSAGTDDARGAIDAFLAKQRPTFHGR